MWSAGPGRQAESLVVDHGNGWFLVRVSTSWPAAGGRNIRNIGSSRVMRGAVITLLLLVGVLSTLLAGCNAGHTAAPSAAAHHVTPAPPPPVAVISTDPPDRAAAVSPLTPVTVTVAKGKLTQVSLTNPQGAPVAGKIDPDGKAWKTTGSLGYGK